MIRRLINYGKKQSFQPNLLSLFINPFFIIRKRLFTAIKEKSHFMNGKMLDFGCGRKPYENIFLVDEYIGIDIEISGHNNIESKVDVYYDGEKIPFESNYFDSFFCSEVFEHVFNLDDIINELYRVLKPEGFGLITIPFGWPEHEQPYDFARYTSFGIEHILKKHSFEVLSYEKTGHYIEVILQLWILYIFNIVNVKNIIVRTFLVTIFISPLNFLSILLKLMPKDKTLFHNSIIIVKKNKENFIIGNE